MTRSANNVWSIRRGLDGADHALLEELEHLTAATISANHSKSAGRPADLVILIALDHIYAPAIRRLQAAGRPDLGAAAGPLHRRRSLQGGRRGHPSHAADGGLTRV